VKWSRLSYVSHEGRDEYWKANPYSRAAMRVTFGFRKMCVSGCAINPNTVTTGQVSTLVCLRGRVDTFSHHRLKRVEMLPVP